MPLYRTEAVTLRTYDLKEADRIVVLLTRNEGKVRAVAKGVRKLTSRLAGGLLPFTHANFLLHRGRELDRVVQCEAVAAFRPLQENLERMAAASFLAELVDGLAGEKDPHGGLFASFLLSLHWLAAYENLPLALTYAQGLLLVALGYLPELEACVRCGGSLADVGAISYSPEEGGVLCRHCRPAARAGMLVLSRGAVETMKRLLQGDPGRMKILQPSAPIRREMDGALRATLLQRLDRRPKSLDFLELVLGERERS